jgi:hypothetical protein
MLDAAGQTLVARLPARSGLRERAEAALHLDMANAVVFDPKTGASLMVS